MSTIRRRNLLFGITSVVASCVLVITLAIIDHRWYAERPLSVSLSAKSVTVSDNGNLVVRANDGNALIFEATVDGGVPPYSFVWMKDGVPIAGAASKNTLLVEGDTANNQGAYSVQVTDSQW